MRRLILEEPYSRAAIWSRRLAVFAAAVAAMGSALSRAGVIAGRFRLRGAETGGADYELKAKLNRQRKRLGNSSTPPFQGKKPSGSGGLSNPAARRLAFHPRNPAVVYRSDDDNR